MHIVDPDLVPEAEHLIAAVAAGRRRAIYRRIAWMAAAVLALGALAFAWWLTPLRQYIDFAHLVQATKRLGDAPGAPLLVIGAYPLAGIAFVPVNVLIAVTVLVFGPVLGVVYALLGCELSAWLLYELGAHFPAGALRTRIERATQRLRPRLARHGLLAVALVRFVPVAPYCVVNIAAGAMGIPRMQYLAGTALGMLPGIVFNALFIDRVVAAIEQPRPSSYLLLLLAAVLLVALAAVVRRRVARAHA